jgi:5-methylcytosine-specific restriction endonuclease McrA
MSNFRPICIVDSCNNSAVKRWRNKKFVGYRDKCNKHTRSLNGQTMRLLAGNQFLKEDGNKSYRHYKKSYCQNCGLIPTLSCVLQVDHIDSDRTNNNPDNLQTLCANCHAVKTHLDHHSGVCNSGN